MSVHRLRRGCIADAYQAAAGLTIVSYADSGFANLGGTTTRTVSGISVVTGDLLVVLISAEDATVTMSAPTGGGLTYTSRQVNFSGSNCYAAGYTAPATSTTTLSVSSTAPGTDKAAGLGVFVCRNGSYGTSSAEVGTTEAPSLDITTTAANSVILYICADWNALDGTSRTWRSVNSIVGTERNYFRDSVRYTNYVGSWANVGATGTKAVGLSAPAGIKSSQIAIEVVP